MASKPARSFQSLPPSHFLLASFTFYTELKFHFHEAGFFGTDIMTPCCSFGIVFQASTSISSTFSLPTLSFTTQLSLSNLFFTFIFTDYNMEGTNRSTAANFSCCPHFNICLCHKKKLSWSQSLFLTKIRMDSHAKFLLKLIGLYLYLFVSVALRHLFWHFTNVFLEKTFENSLSARGTILQSTMFSF